MFFEYFFARRITTSAQKAISTLVVRLAILSIALAVGTMLISVSIVQGFEDAITQKVEGFNGQIQLGNYYQNIETKDKPLPKFDKDIRGLEELDEITSVVPYAVQSTLCKSDTERKGAQLKGYDQEFDWSFFASVLVEGAVPHLEKDKVSREVILSKKNAKLLRVSTGDDMILFFLRGENVKSRRVKVTGIYESGMEEFDAIYLFGDIRLVQNARSWSENQVSGFEIRTAPKPEDCGLKSISSFPFFVWECSDPLLEASTLINNFVPYQYAANPITLLFPDVFQWLDLTYQNVWFIMVLMMIVAFINMSSVILILIIERTQTIGILKSMGLDNQRARRIFVIRAFFLILIGVILGNLLGLGILYSQYEFEWLKLDQENYFISVAPVAWVWGRFALVNIAVILLCTLFMFVPSVIVTRISPLKAIRFE